MTNDQCPMTKEEDVRLRFVVVVVPSADPPWRTWSLVILPYHRSNGQHRPNLVPRFSIAMAASVEQCGQNGHRDRTCDKTTEYAQERHAAAHVQPRFAIKRDKLHEKTRNPKPPVPANRPPVTKMNRKINVCTRANGYVTAYAPRIAATAPLARSPARCCRCTWRNAPGGGEAAREIENRKRRCSEAVLDIVAEQKRTALLPIRCIQPPCRNMQVKLVDFLAVGLDRTMAWTGQLPGRSVPTWVRRWRHPIPDCC